MASDDAGKQPGIAASPRRNLRRSLTLQAKELKQNLHKPVGSARVALRQELTLSFPHFQSFLTEYSSNLSMTGMFVRTETSAPAGTLVDFVFRLDDGLRLIHGRAEVVWVRENRGDPFRPPGMSLRFLRLDAQSRRLIRWLVEKHVADEGALVDFKDFLRASRPAPIRRDLDLHKLYPYAGVGVARGQRARPDRPRWRRLGLIAAAALVTMLALGFLQRFDVGTMIAQEARRVPAGAAAAAVTRSLELALEDGRWRILEEIGQKKTTAPGVEAPPAGDGYVRQAGRIEIVRRLSLRGGPSSTAPRVRMISPGTVLEFVGWTTGGEAVSGNSHWYEDAGGNYFWAGGTAAPTPGA